MVKKQRRSGHDGALFLTLPFEELPFTGSLQFRSRRRDAGGAGVAGSRSSAPQRTKVSALSATATGGAFPLNSDARQLGPVSMALAQGMTSEHGGFPLEDF